MPPRSLEPDQTAKLVERLANKCGKTVPGRLILEFIKARTLNRTLLLAARSNSRSHAQTAQPVLRSKNAQLLRAPAACGLNGSTACLTGSALGVLDAPARSRRSRAGGGGR